MSNKGEKRPCSIPLIIALVTFSLILLALGTKHYFPNLSCPVKAQWNIECPGCGGTRALESLITGNLPSAFSYNPIITLGIIFITIYCLISLYCRVLGLKSPAIKFSLYKGISAILVIIVFTIIRNL